MILATTKSIGRMVRWYAKVGMSRVRTGKITGITPEQDVIVKFNDSENDETLRQEDLNWVSGNNEADRSIFKKETVFTVDYNDLDNLLEGIYGFPVECTACWEQGNYSAKELNIDGDIDDWEEKELKSFKKDGTNKSRYGLPQLLMNDLCRQDKIESGTYMVDIFW